MYDITFKRLSSESSMDAVLERPWAEEVEDFSRYKRLKQEARDKQEEAARKAAETKPGVVVSGSDGTVDTRSLEWERKDSIWHVYDEDQFAESPKGSIVVRQTSRRPYRK